jgi:hypothetical protein
MLTQPTKCPCRLPLAGPLCQNRTRTRSSGYHAPQRDPCSAVCEAKIPSIPFLPHLARISRGGQAPSSSCVHPYTVGRYFGLRMLHFSGESCHPEKTNTAATGTVCPAVFEPGLPDLQLSHWQKILPSSCCVSDAVVNSSAARDLQHLEAAFGSYRKLDARPNHV